MREEFHSTIQGESHCRRWCGDDLHRARSRSLRTDCVIRSVDNVRSRVVRMCTYVIPV